MKCKNCGMEVNDKTKFCPTCGSSLEWIKEEKREANGVVLDSRLLQEGYVFIATKGEKVDGHKFIPSVFEKGAMAVICEEVPEVLTQTRFTRRRRKAGSSAKTAKSSSCSRITQA